jgi:hypothetical protein
MENVRPLNQSTIALRERICPECEWRGDKLEAADELACEKLCALFVHLPRLTRIVAQFGSEPPCGYDNVIDHFLRCAHEQSGSTQSDGEAPLRAYAADALAVIERVVARRDYQPSP